MKEFRKRTFTIKTFFRDMTGLYNNFGEIKKARKRKLISARFIERIMLSVTQVNKCRVCSFAHTKAALATGISKKEIDSIFLADFGDAPKEQVTALCFAQYYAENDGRYEQEYIDKLNENYGVEGAKDILTYIKIITFGNLSGNTFEAFMLRFTGRKITGSSFWEEFIILLAMITILPVLFLLAIIFK